MIHCTKCGSTESKVTITNKKKSPGEYSGIVRRRKCKDCGESYLTFEATYDELCLLDRMGGRTKNVFENDCA
jgi:transcriptional regulator NrdR family protein